MWLRIMGNSIRFRLTATFMGLAILPLLLVGIILSWQSYKNERSQAINIQNEIGQRIAEQTTSLIKNAEGQLRALSSDPNIYSLLSLSGDARHDAHFAGMLSSDRLFEQIGLLDSNGQIASHVSRGAHSDKEHFDDRLSADGILEAPGTETSIFGPVRFNDDGDPTMSIAIPIIDKRTGSVDGYLIGIVQLEVAWELIGQIRVGDEGTAFIIDQQGRVIAHRNPSVVLRKTQFQPPDKDGVGMGLSGEKSIISSQLIRIGGQEFRVITEKPFSEAMALTIRFAAEIGLVLLAAMVAAGVVALAAVRVIIRPIERLATVAKALQSGRLDQRANITSNDEMGTLGEAFDTMADKLLETIDALALQNTELQSNIASRQFAEQELESQKQELASSNRELEGHYKITRIFAESGDLESKATAALENLVDLSGADWATLRLANETEPGLHLTAAAGPAAVESPPVPVITQAQVISTAAYTEGRISVINDYAAVPTASQRLLDLGMQSMVILPVKAGERTLGLVTVISKSKNHFIPDLVNLLTSTVDGLGVLVENSILYDETEKAHQELQQLAEALSRSNQELEQFANIASHDLQEPLRMVSSYTQLLASRYKDKLDSEAQEFIGYAVDGAKRMQAQIKDLLEWSRLTTQSIPFEPTVCSEIFEQATGNLSVSIEERGAIVTSDPLPTVNGDRSQLVSVFQNLIGNGIKYQGDQQPRLHVSAVENGDEWLFSFSDNGIGIEPQYAERIFVIFQRLHGKSEYSGTGIGLAICKKVIERHGGRIWVESEPQKGSTFYFTLPMGILKGHHQKEVEEHELQAN